MRKTLIETLLENGYPKDQMFHHCSDLYIFKNNLTTKVVNEWFNDNNLNPKLFVSVFTDNITGLKMYDVAFQYYI